ncbi:MAG: RidA family protein [Pseudomonadota bacterium]
MNQILKYAALSSLFFLSACQSPTGVRVLTTPAHEALGLPFSEAVIAGDLIFVSGQLGTKPGTAELVSGGIEPQTRQTMANIQAILERYGASMDNVAKCTIFINDMRDWSAMNTVYLTFFPNHKPARSALGANGLALGAAVEIECIAALK